MKRMIFALLYNDGQFILSRNFRQQRVGDISWVLNNYNLLNVSCGVDELAVLDIGEKKDHEKFAEHIKTLSNACFIPLSAGGGIEDAQTAKLYLDSGADKLILNTSFYNNRNLCTQLANRYGSQCIIAGIDYVKNDEGYKLFATRADLDNTLSVETHIQNAIDAGAGELLLQSVDQDGTGNGLEIGFAIEYLQDLKLPCIMLGGVGKAEHIKVGLEKPYVDAVCTANLLSFIGDSLEKSRVKLIDEGIPLPMFTRKNLDVLRDYFKT